MANPSCPKERSDHGNLFTNHTIPSMERPSQAQVALGFVGVLFPSWPVSHQSERRKCSIEELLAQDFLVGVCAKGLAKEESGLWFRDDF